MRKILGALIVLLSIVLVACTTKTYHIIFETNGGNDIPRIEFSGSYALEDIEKIIPTKPGYVFGGWYLNNNLNEDSLLTDDIEDDIKLYANWYLIQYELILNLDGGTLHEDQVLSFTTVDTVLLLEPTKEDYEFLGWSKSPNSDHYVDQVEAGTIGHQTFYANWSESPGILTYNIQFKHEDGSLLSVVTTENGQFPIYVGPVPTKPNSETHRYTFIGWDSEITVATSDKVYTAVFESELLDQFDPADLNIFFDEDVYALIPNFNTADYDVFEISGGAFIGAGFDLFDWTEADRDAYDALLDSLFEYDEDSGAYKVESYFISTYKEEYYYPGQIVFGVEVYARVDIPMDQPLDIEAFNDVFGFDMYSLLPSFTATQAYMFNWSFEEFIYIYVDIFNWTEADFNQFKDDLAATFEYDEEADAYILGSYYILPDVDETLYEGMIVYGFGIDGFNDGTAPTIPDNPGNETGNLTTLSPMQSINAYEKSTFGASGLPSTGEYNVLVIPIEIQGHPFESTYATQLDKVFNANAIHTGWRSVSGYYFQSSYGNLELTFDIAPKYVTTNPASYYENQALDGDQYAIVEALQALDSQIDFSQYDVNNDGYIDSVIFVYSKAYDYDVDPWWAWVFSGQYGVASSIGKLDGKTFDYYMWASYEFIYDTIPGYDNLHVNSETFVHELGHLMGFPDLYSYEGDYEFGPLGGFDMMDYNVGDHGPLNKLLFGWLQPLVAKEGTYQVTLDNFGLDNDPFNNTLLIPYDVDDLDDGNAFDEYLLVTFYSPNGLYAAHSQLETVPEYAGVVVYHVDARMFDDNELWYEYFLYNNDGNEDFFVRILEADKNNSLPGNGSITQSDLLTSGTLDLSSYTWHQGGQISVSISVATTITNDAENVTLNITVS